MLVCSVAAIAISSGIDSVLLTLVSKAAAISIVASTGVLSNVTIVGASLNVTGALTISTSISSKTETVMRFVTITSIVTVGGAVTISAGNSSIGSVSIDGLVSTGQVAISASIASINDIKLSGTDWQVLGAVSIATSWYYTTSDIQSVTLGGIAAAASLSLSTGMHSAMLIH